MVRREGTGDPIRSVDLVRRCTKNRKEFNQMKKFAKRTIALILSVMMALGMLTLGASAAGTSARFTDIAGNPYAEAIEALAEVGIVNGSGGKYNPDMTIDRAMAVTIIANMAAAEKKDTDRFSDVAKGSYYAGYVGWAVEKLGVSGVGGGLFVPDRPITGYEMDILLSRYAALVGIDYTASNTSMEPITRGEMAGMVYAVYQLATTRTTAYGSVEGCIEDNGTFAWKGVPYGTAERWQAPTAPKAWDGVKDCTETGPMAVQPNQAAASSGGDPTQGEADCLNLDIYAPAGAEGRPVLVFLHGGNNQTGSAVNEFTGEELVVNLDCVFVSLNFRIGPQGFNPLPALKDGKDPAVDSGNFGMLDIAFALDWVKENIAEFGGDPDNITISGNSAGGRNVMAMLISPLFKGKYDKALVSSGGMTVADEEKSAIQFANYLAPLAVRDGKAADEAKAVEYLLTDSKEVKEYLMKLSDEDLIGSFESNAGIRMALFPHLFNDGSVLPKEGFDTTKYYPVPVMMLAGVNEFGFFGMTGAGKAGPDSILNDSTLDAEEKAAATAFAQKYGGDMYRIFNGQVSADTMYPYYGDTPIYVAQFNYGGADSGHCSWFKFCMNTSNAATSFTTEGGWQVYRMFNSYVKNFLHSENGDPNGEGLTKWTSWDSGTKLSMVFDGNEAMTAATAEMKNVSTTYAEIIKAMEEDTTISEAIKKQIIDTCISGRWFSEAQDDHFNAPSFWFVDQAAE